MLDHGINTKSSSLRRGLIQLHSVVYTASFPPLRKLESFEVKSKVERANFHLFRRFFICMIGGRKVTIFLLFRYTVGLHSRLRVTHTFLLYFPISPFPAQMLEPAVSDIIAGQKHV